MSRIVLVWLGGNALHWPDNREFNMYQDVAAGRIVFGCGAALVQLPCAGVVSGFTVSEPEFKDYFLGKNELCDYLAHYAIEEGRRWAQAETWSRVIWGCDGGGVAFGRRVHGPHASAQPHSPV